MIISLYSIKQITETVKGKFVGNSDEYKIKYILIDSRKILHAQASVFFALPGERHDGHEFIAELYDKGIRCFVVSQKVKNTDHFPEGNFIEVRDTLKALQDLCASHRSQFDIPVIGVTGSNGKTIVKEQIDLFPSEKSTLNEKISQEGFSVATKLEKQKISDLIGAIGINERFAFINDLFEGNADDFNEALKKLNSFAEYKEACRYLDAEIRPKYNWDEENQVVLEFLDLIEKRYVV